RAPNTSPSACRRSAWTPPIATPIERITAFLMGARYPMATANTEGRMEGKTCLVTGATSGIGEITARELARLGARVLIVGRSPERSAATIDRIRNETGSGAVESMVADLSSQAEVRRLADEVRGRYERLDLLVNNAGGMFLDRRESVDGIELTL